MKPGSRASSHTLPQTTALPPSSVPLASMPVLALPYLTSIHPHFHRIPKSTSPRHGFAAPGPCVATGGGVRFLVLVLLNPAPRRLPSHRLIQQRREQQTRSFGRSQDEFLGSPGPGDQHLFLDGVNAWFLAVVRSGDEAQGHNQLPF